MKQINISYHKTKIGEIVLGSFEGKLCLLTFRYKKMRDRVDSRLKRLLNAEFIEKEDEIISEAKKQLDSYLLGNIKEFNLPLLLVGTDFQKQVWEGLLKIEYGKTISYIDLAKNINNKKAFRAVANANGSNAISIIIPYHRVIANSGDLGGYGGGLDVKEYLLDLEIKNKYGL